MVQSRGTTASHDQTDRDARPEALAGSGGQVRPGTLDRGRSLCKNDEEEKEKGTASERSIRPSPGKTTRLSRPRLSWRDNRTLMSTRQIKRRSSPIMCVREVSGGLRGGRGVRKVPGRGEAMATVYIVVAR